MKSLFMIVLFTMVLQAEMIGILTKTDRVFTIKTEGKDFNITRHVTPCAKNKGWLQPLVPVKGVTPVTELEILDALKNKSAVLVDMRMGEDFFDETIPNAINIPFNFSSSELEQLGCKYNKKLDCSKAVKVIAFCNGPVCPQSPIGIQKMVDYGYPAQNISYYRGGMLDWSALGLTTVEGKF
jgi:rhodanese-related sulfurtransferase